MMKNKRGQTLGISIIIGITILIVGLMSINFVRDEVTDARLASGLDCSNSTGISDGTKLTCLAVDLVVPYFLLLVLSAVGGIIVARLLL